MPNIIEARDSIQTQFNNTWNAASLDAGESRPPIAWDNIEFQPPTNSTWARCSVQQNIGDQIGLGGVGERYFRRQGLVFVQVFVPIETGTKLLNKWVTTALSAFEGVEFQDVRFRQSRVQDGTPEESWHSALVISEFSYDTIT
jgi:hypothetical protein